MPRIQQTHQPTTQAFQSHQAKIVPVPVPMTVTIQSMVINWHFEHLEKHKVIWHIDFFFALITDSVVLIEDTNSNTVRPIIKDDDEDVIFVTESRASQRFRTIATIDLCDTPDTSFTRSRGSEQSTSAATAGAAASQPASDLSPRRPGTAKCPICLEIFGFNEILSTMCGHLFCEPCIKNVIKARKKCPMWVLVYFETGIRCGFYYFSWMQWNCGI